MSTPDDMKGPASLTAALLARKGSAAPAGFTPRATTGGGAPGSDAADEAVGRPRAGDGAYRGNDVPRAGVLMRRADMPRRGGGGPGDGHSGDGHSGDGQGPGAAADRARVTLRLDDARHLRLKLAAAHLQQSLQEILTTALDRYLNEVAPDLLRDDCTCLAAARARNTEDRR